MLSVLFIAKLCFSEFLNRRSWVRIPPGVPCNRRNLNGLRFLFNNHRTPIYPYRTNSRRLVSSALAMNAPIFPEAYLVSPAVVAYLKDRGGDVPPAPPVPDSGSWLSDYEKEIMGECVFACARNSLTRLHKLDAAMNGIANTTPEK